eukprot:1155833-Pelagomonas_calceolata.AAC.8
MENTDVAIYNKAAEDRQCLLFAQLLAPTKSGQEVETMDNSKSGALTPSTVVKAGSGQTLPLKRNILLAPFPRTS